MDERPIRRAASVVCVRADGNGEPEVLVVRRSSESRFLPGYVAFPGGAVDAGDAAHAERWFGDPALAPRAAAVRELVEEAGIALTAAGLVASDGFGPTDVAPPSPEQLSALCHWVAPQDVPVRFDARYFTVRGRRRRPGHARRRRGDRPVVDDRAAAAGGMGGGAHKLYWPTWLHGDGAGGLPFGRRGARPPVRDARPHDPTRRRRCPVRDGAGVAGAACIRVLAPNPSVYTLEGTNTWVVGDGPTIVIDPGPDDPAHRDEVLDTAGDVAFVLVTPRSRGSRRGRGGCSPNGRTRRCLPSARRRRRMCGTGNGSRCRAWTSWRCTRPATRADHVVFLCPRTPRCSPAMPCSGTGTSFIDPPDGDLAALPPVAASHAGAGAAHDLPGSRTGRHATPAPSSRSTSTHRAEREEQVLAGLAAGDGAIAQLVETIYADYPVGGARARGPFGDRAPAQAGSRGPGGQGRSGRVADVDGYHAATPARAAAGRCTAVAGTAARARSRCCRARRRASRRR